MRFTATAPDEGTNTVVVAHGNLMRAVSGEHTGEAGAAVFAPCGDGRFSVAAVVEAMEWIRMAQGVEPVPLPGDGDPDSGALVSPSEGGYY